MGRVSRPYRRRQAVFHALLIVALFALVEPVWARQCSTNVDREKTAVDSAVFVGEVTDVVRRGGWGWLRFAIVRFKAWTGLAPDYKGYPAERVTFTVKTSWKGVTTPSVQMDAYSYGSFQVGHEYMVYAYGPMDYLSADVCTRTREYFGQPDLDLATAPNLTLAPASRASTEYVGPMVFIGAIVAFVVVWEFRRRRAR